jgi:hypothetical protein
LEENGKNVSGKEGSISASGSKELPLPKAVAALKPELKVGASVAVEHSVEKKSDFVAKAVDSVKQIANEIANRLKRVGCQAGGGLNGPC